MFSVMGGLPQPERVQLERILNHYRSATTLNSTMSLMVDNPEAHENFVSCLQHDVSILLNRSQDMGNHECSTSQKALVILMNKEHNIVAAANLYAEEILGFSAVPSDAESLKAQTKARKDIVESLNLLAVPYSAPPAFIQLPQNETPSRASQIPQKTQENHDPKFTRLWNLYVTAKQELAAIPETQFRLHADAAKFLRDTIQTCIDYLMARHHISSIQRSHVYGSEAQTGHDIKLLEDLHIAFKEAKETVDKYYDGPRRFEEIGNSRRQSHHRDSVHVHTSSDVSNQEAHSRRVGALSTTIGRYEVKRPRAYNAGTHQSSRHLRRSASPAGRGSYRNAEYGYWLAGSSLERRADYGDKVRRFGYRPKVDSYKPSY